MTPKPEIKISLLLNRINLSCLPNIPYEPPFVKERSAAVSGETYVPSKIGTTICSEEFDFSQPPPTPQIPASFYESADDVRPPSSPHQPMDEDFLQIDPPVTPDILENDLLLSEEDDDGEEEECVPAPPDTKNELLDDRPTEAAEKEPNGQVYGSPTRTRSGRSSRSSTRTRSGRSSRSSGRSSSTSGSSSTSSRSSGSSRSSRSHRPSDTSSKKRPCGHDGDVSNKRLRVEREATPAAAAITTASERRVKPARRLLTPERRVVRYVERSDAETQRQKLKYVLHRQDVRQFKRPFEATGNNDVSNIRRTVMLPSAPRGVVRSRRVVSRPQEPLLEEKRGPPQENNAQYRLNHMPYATEEYAVLRAQDRRQSMLNTIMNHSSRKVMFISAVVEDNICFGFAVAVSNVFCEGSGIPYHLKTKLPHPVTTYKRFSPLVQCIKEKKNILRAAVCPDDIVRFCVANTDPVPPIIVGCDIKGSPLLDHFCRLDPLRDDQLRYTGGNHYCFSCFPRQERPGVYVTKAVNVPRLYCQYHARTASSSEKLQLYLPQIVSVKGNADRIWCSTLETPYLNKWRERNEEKGGKNRSRPEPKMYCRPRSEPAAAAGWSTLAFRKIFTRCQLWKDLSDVEALFLIARDHNLVTSINYPLEPVEVVRMLQKVCSVFERVCSPSEVMPPADNEGETARRSGDSGERFFDRRGTWYRYSR